MRSGREVQQLLGERFREVLEDVDLADDADQGAGVVDERDVAVAAATASARWRRGPTGPAGACAGPWSCSVSTGAARSTPAATSSPTSRAKMSRSARTPTSRPSGSVTKTESPVPVRLDGPRQSPIDEPGATVTGCRRPTTLNGADTRPGTRAAVARSVSSVTRPVYARMRVRAVGRTGVHEATTTSDTLADVDRTRACRHHARRHQRHRVRLGRPVREARLRDRRRLADAHGVAVRHRRRDGVGRAGVQPVGATGAATAPEADAPGGGRPRRVLRHQHRHVLRGARRPCRSGSPR